MRGQPAEKAGVRSGDIVLKVDGKDITGLDVNDAVLLIRGPKGTQVVLTIKREDEPKLIDIPVVRDRIAIPSVAEARTLEKEGAPDVGYVQLTVFAEETKGEMDAALDELRAKGAKAIVLDLRNNPGGYLETAIQVASEFLDHGVVVMQEDGRGVRRSESAHSDGHATALPLVVLINKGSASASEIVAGAIRDNKRGVLVGETSFGKGSVQNVHSLSDDSQLRVTVAAWLTPDGSHIHKKGIPPDIEVGRTSDDVKAGRDPQLERAIQAAQDAIAKGQG
jgi:carboxyl-terminal processing protease